MKVEVGDQVKKGDVLATLDTSVLQLKVTQAEQAYVLQQLTYSETVKADASDIAVAEATYNSALASYNAARQDYNSLADKEAVQCSSLTSAKANLDRAQTAYDRLANDHQAKDYLNSDWGPFQSVVRALTDAQSAYDQALASCNVTKLSLNDSSLRSAQAQVQSAKASLDNLVSPRVEKQVQAAAALEQARLSWEQAKRNMANATITAPFDGVVTDLNAKLGSSINAGEPAVTIADFSHWVVNTTDLTEIDVVKVKEGDPVTVTLDALPGVELNGTISSIGQMYSENQGDIVYEVIILLTDAHPDMRWGMTAAVNFENPD